MGPNGVHDAEGALGLLLRIGAFLVDLGSHVAADHSRLLLSRLQGRLLVVGLVLIILGPSEGHRKEEDHQELHLVKKNIQFMIFQQTGIKPTALLK